MNILVKIVNKFFIASKKSIKNTCVCCGYKTLTTNDIGEICPICYWEEDCLTIDEFFEYSSANYCILYEAQENYNIFGAYKKSAAKYCRKPCSKDIKDANWIPSQIRIENSYESKVKITHKIKSLIEELSFSGAKEIYINFKSLPDILVFKNTISQKNNSTIYDNEIHEKQLLLKALSIYLVKNRSLYLMRLTISYYHRGLHYYIGWSIMLIIILNKEPFIIANKLDNLLINIEENNFYGINSLQKTAEQYWNNSYNSQIRK